MADQHRFRAHALIAVSTLLVPLAAQLPQLTPVTLADQPTIGIAAGGQRQAAMAAGGSASLLVFEDNRAGDYDLFGLRVDTNGDPIDAVPFTITRVAGNQTAPRVVWNGHDWLVVFRSEVDPGSGYFAQQVSAVRVSAQGVALDATPLAIALDSTGAYFAVASDGIDWVVAFTGLSAGNSDVRARRVRADGALLDPAGVVVQPASFVVFFHLTASYAGGNYLFTWDENGMRGRRFTPALAAVDAASVPLPVGQGAVCGNGSHFLFSWLRQTPQFQQQVVAQRFAPTMTPLDPAPLVVSDPATSPYPEAVSSVWDGSQWIVAWTQPAADARLARISSGGTVFDAGGVVLPDNTTAPLYAPALGALPGGGALHLWHQARFASAEDVYAVRFTATGQPGAESCLSLGGEALSGQRLAAAGDGYLLVALASRSDRSRVLAWRLDALGRSLDPQPIEVAAANHTRLEVGASAWNGTHHLVVFADGVTGQVLARRLQADGQWADPAPFVVMPGFAPDVAANGSDFLVTGLHYPSYPQFIDSFGARVRGSDGAVLDAPARPIGSSYARRARVVELGGRWLVATQSHWSHDQSQGGVSLHFVDANGLVTAATGMAVLTMQGGGIVDLASSGQSALVVAQSGSNWTNTEIYVQRVLPNGTSPVPMATITGPAPMGQSRPSVTWNGHNYDVTYETYQNNAWFYDFESDVYGIRLAEDGSQLDATGRAFWHGPGYEVRSDGAGLGGGRALHGAGVFDDTLAAMRIALLVERPLGLTTFGTGTPGCHGPHGIDANGPPTAGNPGFVVRFDRGPANGIGALALGTGSHVAGFDPGLGFLLHIDLAPPHAFGLATVFADGDGVATMALPLTPIPAWLGFRMTAQGAFLWQQCQPTVSGISTSPGLEIVLQNP